MQQESVCNSYYVDSVQPSQYNITSIWCNVMTKYSSCRCNNFVTDGMPYIRDCTIQESSQQSEVSQYLFDNCYTDNQKGFWSLVKRLRKNYEPVILYADDYLKTTPVSKAEALIYNQQFYSVFTKEDYNTPLISSPQYPNMLDVANIYYKRDSKIIRRLESWQSCRA